MATKVNLNDEAWDDESFAEYYSNDNDEGYDDDESILGDIGGAIKSGVKTVGNILTNPLGTAANAVSGIGKVLGVTSSPASTAGIQNKPHLTGNITTAGGRTIPVQVDASGVKQDIQILQGAIQKINNEIKQVADTTTTNGLALTKLSKTVKAVETASVKQNDMIAKLGSGVDKLGKDLNKVKSQEQMNMMMSLLLQPQIESVKFKKIDGSAKPVTTDEVTDFQVSTKTSDNTLLFLLMAMSGSGDNNSGGFGDLANNPLMMILLFKSLSGGSSII